MEEEPSPQAAANLREHAAELAPVVDLLRLTPIEVIAANRYAWQQVHAAGERGDEAAAKAYGRYATVILEATGPLLASHPEFGRAVFEQGAYSLDADDRMDAANTLREAIEADHDFGLQHFDQLLRDRNDRVRSAAYNILSGLVVPWPTDTEDGGPPSLGLSEAETTQLLDAYTQAERGERLFHLGEIAFRRLLHDPQAAPGDDDATSS